MRLKIVDAKQPRLHNSFNPPEDGCEKRPKHVGVLYLQTRF
jgi:hypothetical protein